MRVYQIGANLVPRIIGNFRDKREAGEHVHRLYEEGLDEEANAFYVVVDGMIRFYISVSEEGYFWEESEENPDARVNDVQRNRARCIVRDAERDLERVLSPGERRDLLLDNTRWTSTEARVLVAEMYPNGEPK